MHKQRFVEKVNLCTVNEKKKKELNEKRKKS